MKFKKLPGVTSFKRAVVITDGVMSNLFEDGSTNPVEIIRHGIRGTQNVVGDADEKKGTSKKDREISNVQETDTAKLNVDAVGMRVEFKMRFLPLVESLDACNDKDSGFGADFKQSFKNFVAAAADSAGLIEVAARYARNIVNGRWLWRNRTLAEAIQISVLIGDEGEELIFDALDIPLNFGDYSKDEMKLAAHIARGFCGQRASSITVTADLDFGIKGAIEVFPSQNFLGDKPRGFARSLYKYNAPKKINKTDSNCVGYAAIRDQKIGNALRVIDTWYPEFNEIGLPIAVEPNGANLEQNKFFRKNSASSFKLFLSFDEIDPSTDQGMFCIASIIRGGVYSGGNKDEE